MDTVTIEIWAWPVISNVTLAEVKKRVIHQEKILPGMCALDLFNRMADKHDLIQDLAFDRERQKFYFHVSVVFNERIVTMSELSKTVLKDGDKIVIIPAVAGG